MNDIKIYISLLGAFIFQILALGTFNMLLGEAFFTRNNLVMSVVATTLMSIFILKKHRKTKHRHNKNN